MARTDPIRPTDDDARALARRLIGGAAHGALGVLLDGRPHVTRIAVTTDEDGCPLTLVSDLSAHTRALRAAPRASLLLGEPGPKGDPLTHARVTLDVMAHFVDKTDAYRRHYLARVPKATLYFDFADFHLVRLEPQGAELNGGFGKAFRLTPDDLGL